MREIEFRGQTGHGRWIYGSLVYSESVQPAIYFETGHGEVKTMDWAYVNPDTVGQYTGLRDKNGKKIYEGDILGADNKVIGWVKGGVRGYCYDVVYIKKDVNDPPFSGDKRWSLYSTIQDDYPNMIEVIGNIHDNPELIKA